MKSFIVLAVLVAAAVAAPPLTPDGAAEILELQNDNIGVEGYNYNAKTSNGISIQESGQLKAFGTDAPAIVVQGEYSYTGTDGKLYRLVYIADENGFQPQADYLPTV